MVARRGGAAYRIELPGPTRMGRTTRWRDGIDPLRIGEERRKGYELVDFADAFSRYLPARPPDTARPPDEEVPGEGRMPEPRAPVPPAL